MANDPRLRKPAPLAPGDAVAVLAPGAAVDRVRVESGMARLERAGLRVHPGAHLFDRHGYLAGSDSARLADLHAAFADPEIKAIFCARGGYGCGRLLPHLDRQLLRDNPKVFVGHSDLTFLLTDLMQGAGLVAFHGPLVAALDELATSAMLATVTGDRAPWLLNAPTVVQPGTAEGPLVGGCLSIVTAMLGTPYALDTRGRILFLEDIGEKPYRVDRMLTQLRQAGVFDGVAGVVFGEMIDCSAGRDETVRVLDVVREAFAGAPFPVAYGLPSGHGHGTVTLPFGIHARLSGERLVLLESPLAT